MLTPFGRFIRKLRIDTGFLLKDLANDLEVTPSYLSAVEMGKRRIPDSWSEKICSFFSLNQSQGEELRALIQADQSKIQIDLGKASQEQRDLAFVFARKLDGLDENEVQEMFKIFKKGTTE